MNWKALLPLYHGSDTGVFPVERIPDGDTMLPHHHWTGIFLAVYIMWYQYGDVPDDTPRWAAKPAFTVAGLMLSAYGWLFLWQNATSPFWGAAFSLVGTTAAMLSVVVAPYWRQNSLKDYRDKIATMRSDAAACVGSGWRETLRCTADTVANSGITPKIVAKGVARRVMSTRFAALGATYIAFDDAADHALPITMPLDGGWAGGGHAISDLITEWAVTFTRWLSGAIHVYVDILTELLTILG